MIPLTASTHPFTPDSLKGKGGSSPPKILVHIPDYGEREQLYLTLAAEGHKFHGEAAQREETLKACDIAYDPERADEIKGFLQGAWQQLDADTKALTELQRRIYPLPPKERKAEIEKFDREHVRELSDDDATRHDNIVAHLRKVHVPLKRMIVDNGRFQLASNDLMAKRFVKGWQGLDTAPPQSDELDEGMDDASLNRLRAALSRLSPLAWTELVNYLSSLMVLDADAAGNFVSPLSTEPTEGSSTAATGNEAMANG